MVKKKGTDDFDLESFDINRESLKSFYSDAKEKSEELWPDTAIKRLDKLMGEVVEREGVTFAEAIIQKPRFDSASYLRDLHHFAVELLHITGNKRVRRVYIRMRRRAPPTPSRTGAG